MEKCKACGQEIQKKTSMDEIRKVVTVFKMVSGFEKEDKAWDRLFFARYTRSAKGLIAFMGSWEWAADAVQEIYEKMQGLGFTATFETVVKHSAEWKKNKLEMEAKHGIRDMQGDGSKPVERRATDSDTGRGGEPRPRLHAV